MGFLSPILSFFAIPPTRNFAGISGYVTINETTTDVLEITQQPVQQGASISDHAFKKPINLSIQMQFNANLFNQTISQIGESLLGGSGQALAQIYQSLLQLQVPVPPNVLTPFTVVTPKRVYQNMLLATLGCTTDKHTENVLSITCAFQEVITVPITTTSVPLSQLVNPGNNGGVQNVGNKSAILQIVGAVTGGR